MVLVMVVEHINEINSNAKREKKNSYRNRLLINVEVGMKQQFHKINQ